MNYIGWPFVPLLKSINISTVRESVFPWIMHFDWLQTNLLTAFFCFWTISTLELAGSKFAIQCCFCFFYEVSWHFCFPTKEMLQRICRQVMHWSSAWLFIHSWLTRVTQAWDVETACQARSPVMKVCSWCNTSHKFSINWQACRSYIMQAVPIRHVLKFCRYLNADMCTSIIIHWQTKCAVTEATSCTQCLAGSFANTLGCKQCQSGTFSGSAGVSWEILCMLLCSFSQCPNTSWNGL